MDTLSFKTISAKNDTVVKEWLIIDATDQTVGRLASEIAKLLRGKHKPYFTPHVDCGDNVIVINAEKIVFTGKKYTEKQYVRHSGYPGGQRFKTPQEMMNKKPEFIIENAVRGMLPKSRLGRVILKNLFVYVGEEHPHEAQKPKELKITDIK